MFDELVPLDEPWKGRDEVFERKDATGTYTYAKVGTSWEAYNDGRWVKVHSFFGDALTAYVSRYWARKDQAA